MFGKEKTGLNIEQFYWTFCHQKKPNINFYFQDRGDQHGQGGVVDYYKIFAVSFATLAAILSV